MKPTFESTVDILVKAYLNDTLVHGFCTACAVGNIIAASMEFELIKDDYEYTAPDWPSTIRPQWSMVFSCSGDVIGRSDFQEVSPKNYDTCPGARQQIDATGYTWQDLAKIELAFESTPHVGTKEQRMFAGLMNVVDALADIHGINLKSKEEAKLLFVKP